MNIAIRTDASTVIGTGHVIRCLTLAKILRDKGVSVSFICRELEGHFCDLIETQEFVIYHLRKGVDPSPLSFGHDTYHAPWLGVSWKEDAEETAEIISAMKKKPDWLIVDHYALDERWEKYLRPYVHRIFVIDDLADREHDCDLLLDQNLVAGMHIRYEGKVPHSCELLLGPKYALLQSEYADLHERIPPRERPVKRILISFGGVDQSNLTGMALSALRDLNCPDIRIDVVLSDSSPHYDAVHTPVFGRKGIQLYSNLPSLASLMAKADLAIGAAGTTSWERLCLGLPAVVVTTAENQKAIAHGLEQQGLIKWLGHKDVITTGLIQECVNELIENERLEEWSSRCNRIVDGLGAVRVSTVLTISPNTILHIRRARLSDEDMLLSWANDPQNNSNSYSIEKISPDIHHRWFYNLLRDVDNVFLYIMETTDWVPVGQVRFERINGLWNIDYSLATDFRNRGIEVSLLKIGLCSFRREYGGVIELGRINKENVSPRKNVESLNFTAEPEGRRWRISVCSDTESWMNEYIPDLLVQWVHDGHEVRWAHDAAELPSGDLCFFLSYGKIVNRGILMRHQNNLVVHESDLPKGRGWSPLTWQILEGANIIPITLFEATEKVDSGPIYLQEWVSFDGSELVDELRREQARATIYLCVSFVKGYPDIIREATPQIGHPTYYSRRYPKDSQINPDRTIRDQFNLLRIADKERYPIWLNIKAKTYFLFIQREKFN